MKTRLIYFFAGILLVSVFYSCNPLSEEDKKAIKDHPSEYTKTIPTDYINLFNNQNKDKLKFKISIERKNRDTTSTFFYQGKYVIQIYRLSEAYSRSLATSIHENYNMAQQEVHTIFGVNYESEIDILDRLIVPKNDKPSEIFVSLNGRNSGVSCKNDSIVDYHTELNSFATTYKLNGPQEFFAKTNHSHDGLTPVEILFLKKNKRLYLLFLSPKGGYRFAPKMLYDLIVG